MDTALFSPANLFQGDRDEKEVEQHEQLYVERSHTFPGKELKIREYTFHQLNANLLWPGTFAFSEWLVEHQSILHGQHILELGCGTGALAIFLRRSFGVDITTCDYDDGEIEENIAYNCKANELDVLPHVRHSWGDPFPTSQPDWDMIIASDILLYVKQYPNLMKTLCFLLRAYRHRHPKETVHENSQIKRSITISGKGEFQLPIFLMSWRRRIGKEDESLFFTGCEKAGLKVQHVGSRVYCIY